MRKDLSGFLVFVSDPYTNIYECEVSCLKRCTFIVDGLGLLWGHSGEYGNKRHLGK